jgi:hypothetical protein
MWTFRRAVLGLIASTSYRQIRSFSCILKIVDPGVSHVSGTASAVATDFELGWSSSPKRSSGTGAPKAMLLITSLPAVRARRAGHTTRRVAGVDVESFGAERTGVFIL